MLIDDGYLVREDDRWVAAGDLSEVKVPPTVQALIAARLDRLTPLERAVLERAAIIGTVFAAASIRSLASEELSGEGRRGHQGPAEEGPDPPGPRRPRRRGRLPVPASPRPGCRLRRHAEGAAGRSARGVRRLARTRGSVRRRAGRVRRVPPRAGLPVPRGARSGGRRRERDRRSCGWTHLLAAGERALGRGDVAAAERLLGRAMALLPAGDPRALSAMPATDQALYYRGQLERTLDYLERGVRPSERARAPRRSAPGSPSIGRWSGRTSTRSSRCVPP